MSRPTPDQLRALLRYDPETGQLFWRVRSLEYVGGFATRPEQELRRWNARHAGQVAFPHVSKKGHLVGCVLGVPVRAHSVAWAIYYGEWPAREIDHRNRNPADNRIKNLRLATPRQNACNRKPQRGSASGLKGVSPWGRKWKAVITVAGRGVYLGLFPTASAAARAYDSAAARLHGEFAATNQSLGLLKENRP